MTAIHVPTFGEPVLRKYLANWTTCDFALTQSKSSISCSKEMLVSTCTTLQSCESDTAKPRPSRNDLLAAVAHMLCLCHLQPNLAIVDVCSMASCEQQSGNCSSCMPAGNSTPQKVPTLPGGTAACHLES